MGVFGNIKSDFIEKMNKAKFVSFDDDKEKLVGEVSLELETKEGEKFTHTGEITVTVYTDIATGVHDFERLPVRAIARVEIDGHYVGGWGASDSEENSILIEWWVRTKADIRNAAFKRKQKQQEHLTKLWREGEVK